MPRANGHLQKRLQSTSAFAMGFKKTRGTSNKIPKGEVFKGGGE